MNLNTIIQHEIDYISLFCETKKVPSGQIYFDINQRDKYYHNYMHVLDPHAIHIEDLKTYHRDFKGYGHINYRLEFEPDASVFDWFLPYKLDQYGYYHARLEELVIKPNPDYQVRVIDTTMKELFIEHSYQENKIYGESFAKNNAIRQWDVLMKNPNYRYFLVFDQDKVVGSVNAFWQNNGVKIDDFSILDTHQRRGIGSSLMHQTLDYLKRLGVSEVFLVTEMNDTPKEMYQKWGFKYVGCFYHALAVYPSQKEGES